MRATPVVDAVAGEPQLQRESHEPLLRTVVKIALDLLPRLVGSSHDTRAGGGELCFCLATLGDVSGERVTARLVFALDAVQWSQRYEPSLCRWRSS